MVFITHGWVGSGTSCAVIARIAKAVGALTVAVVTRHSEFERFKALAFAIEGIANYEHVDTFVDYF